VKSTWLYLSLAIVVRAVIAGPVIAGAAPPPDAAAAFGARESVEDLSLSPDGAKVAYRVPLAGQGSAVLTLALEKDAKPRVVMTADGKPDRIGDCKWVSNDRLVCTIYGVVADTQYDVLPFTREIAVNTDGSNLRLLSTRQNEYSHGIQLGGGTVIDWLPEESGAVLMTRVYIPDDHLSSRIGSTVRGLGVDRIDTQTLQTKQVEPPRPDAEAYISDGRGTVRIVASRSLTGAKAGNPSSVVDYAYRKPGSREWLPLSQFDTMDLSGFEPVAVDHDLNAAYGYQKKDGRLALYRVSLDGSLHTELVFSRPDVDVGGLLRIGRRNRVVGVSYTTDVPHVVFFDPGLEKLGASLAHALKDKPLLNFVDSNLDESKLLLCAGSDDDPGVYYIFDSAARHLQTFYVVRSELEGRTLAHVKPVTYPAADGTAIPGYLTLPPGVDDARGLPAIVMPHGGPTARDVWRFDYLAQYFASRGFVVLQPNFRGSWGYGDEWLEKNGFQSWRVAIGDVVDAGHWLVTQGIADPAKLGIVGWSYGGYAALQSAVVDPSLFKAVVAIAPVTDFALLKEQHRHWSDFAFMSRYIGDGEQARAGSPADNAAKIKVPVLLFHGTLDRNVLFMQSREMDERLAKAGAPHELVRFEGLDHYLEDSGARSEMLRKSDEFLHEAMNF